MQLSEQRVNRITGSAFTSDGGVAKLIFESESRNVTVFDRGSNKTYFERLIPDGYTLVGMYGRAYQGGCMDYTGFIVARFFR